MWRTRTTIDGVLDATSVESAWQTISEMAVQLSVALEFKELDASIDGEKQHLVLAFEQSLHKFLLLINFDTKPELPVVHQIAALAQRCFAPSIALQLAVSIVNNSVGVEGHIRTLPLDKAAKIADKSAFTAAEVQVVASLMTMKAAIGYFRREASPAHMTLVLNDKPYYVVHDDAGEHLLVEGESGEMTEVKV